MSLVKFKSRRPWGSLVTSDFFDMDDFFDNRLWNRVMSNDRFWNGKNMEPSLNIKENDANFIHDKLCGTTVAFQNLW